LNGAAGVERAGHVEVTSGLRPRLRERHLELR
jgi:hypothetical protein